MLLKTILAAGFLPVALVIAHAAPTDIVPRGHIAYDLLGSLASAGRLPGYTLADFARGDRLYTRREIARIISLLPEEISSQDRYASAIRVLRIEFALELANLGQKKYANSALLAKRGEGMGLAKVRLLTGPAAGTMTLRAAGVQPLGRDGYVAVSASNYRDEWYNPHAFDPNRKGGGYATIETAYVRVNGRLLDVSIGRMPLRWGPGYVGGTLFSDESPTLPQIRVEKGFRLPGIVGRGIGPLYFTQFYGQFFEVEQPVLFTSERGTRRHVLGRRLETAGNGRWNVALAEGLKSAELPDPFWSQVVPYYQYQNDWTEVSKHRLLKFLVTDGQPNTYWKNYAGDATISYRAGSERGATLYATLLLDDYKAPKGIGQGDNTPRKVGQQYGVNAPNLDGKGRYGVRLEVAIFDPGTYTNDSPPVNWNYNGVPLGYPSGPNNTTVFSRFDARVTDRVNVAFEGSTRRYRSSAPKDPVSPNIDRLGVYGVYALRPNLFLGSRLEYQKVTASPGASSQRTTRFEINAGIGF